ncbi:MAG: preprotein translocase subunit SecG [Chitinophagaceae bacterium]|nr:preprotein translocase subunit SecG [Chitinophagaceae bacterium]
MTTIFIILIVLASLLLGFIVLVQNPKGGGLASNIAGFSNQFMGVKQTTDVLEKGTWLFAGIIGLLCLFSVFFIPRSSVSGSGEVDRTKEATGAPIPSQSRPQTTPNTIPIAPPAGQPSNNP